MLTVFVRNDLYTVEYSYNDSVYNRIAPRVTPSVPPCNTSCTSV